jgi:hypothetical protein
MCSTQNSEYCSICKDKWAVEDNEFNNPVEQNDDIGGYVVYPDYIDEPISDMIICKNCLRDELAFCEYKREVCRFWEDAFEVETCSGFIYGGYSNSEYEDGYVQGSYDVDVAAQVYELAYGVSHYHYPDKSMYSDIDETYGALDIKNKPKDKWNDDLDDIYGYFGRGKSVIDVEPTIVDLPKETVYIASGKGTESIKVEERDIKWV